MENLMNFKLNRDMNFLFDVWSIAQDPSGERFVAGCSEYKRADYKLRVFEIETGNNLEILGGHTESIHSVAWSQNGKRVISGSDDRTVRVWDTETWKCLKVLEHQNVVRCVSINPDGTRILSKSNTEVYIWDGETYELLKKMPGGRSIVAFSPDGSRFINYFYSSFDIVDINSYESMLKVDSGQLEDAAWSPDGTKIATTDGSLQLWDAETGERIAVIEESKRQNGGAAWSSDGERIVAFINERMNVWDSESFEKLETLNVPKMYIPLIIMFGSQDGRKEYIIVAYGKKIQIWEAVDFGERWYDYTLQKRIDHPERDEYRPPRTLNEEDLGGKFYLRAEQEFRERNRGGKKSKKRRQRKTNKRSKKGARKGEKTAKKKTKRIRKL
jgi:WD40 repeat protein